jgi:hypothetical protein
METQGNYLLINGYGQLLIPAKYAHIICESIMVDRKYNNGKYHIEFKGEMPEFLVVHESQVKAAVAAHKLGVEDGS